ncbi:MAG: B12-binding domain-containing radical SAM protein [Desulfomonilaceae bacterium]
MKVLLINSNRKGDMLAAAPIGLCYVASAIEAVGHSVKALDLCFSGKNVFIEVEQAIHSFEPQVIGVSVRNIDNTNMLHSISYLPDTLELFQIIKRLTDCPIVVGGSAVGLAPEALLKFLKADYVVVSDGEKPFTALLECLERGESNFQIPGVGHMVNGAFDLTPPAMNGFQSPAPDIGRWVDTSAYRKIGAAYNIQTKRGCRRHCIYCTYNQSLEGVHLRLRDPKDVVDEIEDALKNYGPHTFEFVDSVFNDPIDHSIAILEEIVRRPWKARFTAMGVHPNGLDKQYLDLMWKAGFRSLMITPESASDTMLMNYKKGFTSQDVFRAAEALNSTAFAVWWFFMIGGPGETNQTLQASLDFVLENLQKKGRSVTHVAQFFFGVRLYPRTALWQLAKKQGFVNVSTNPLDHAWYVSEDLDLDEAVSQMFDAAAICPEIYLGSDEKIVSFSKIIAGVCRFLHLPGPYWKYMRFGNVIGIRTGIRFIFKPADTAGLIRQALTRQSYSGRLVSGIGESMKELKGQFLGS